MDRCSSHWNKVDFDCKLCCSSYYSYHGIGKCIDVVSFKKHQTDEMLKIVLKYNIEFVRIIKPNTSRVTQQNSVTQRNKGRIMKAVYAMLATFVTIFALAGLSGCVTVSKQNNSQPSYDRK